MKNQKGITLIALVITIIVLLILAGVSIAMLTGNNGILTQANNSKYSTARSEAVEKINLALNAVKTQIYAERVDDANWSPLSGSALQPVIATTLKNDGFGDSAKTVAQTGDAGYYYRLNGSTLYIEYISKSVANITTPISGHIILDSASLTISPATLPAE